MDPELISIHYSDPLWIGIAFLCGLAIRVVGLPPMIGFLMAGFILSALGAEGGEFLNAMADLGITLLLFSIGLKLKLKSLGRPEVWGVATLHMAIITGLVAALMTLLSYTGMPLLTGLDWQTALLIGFAMSFFQHRVCGQDTGRTGCAQLPARQNCNWRTDYPGYRSRGLYCPVDR